jgi:hypothetical protein
MNPTRTRPEARRLRLPIGGPPGRGFLRQLPFRIVVLLVTSLVACATPTVAPGSYREELQDALAAPHHHPALEAELLYAAKGKTGKRPAQPSQRPKAGGETGETEATKRGRQAHKDWDPGDGFEKEVRLPSGKRADAVNPETQEVKELKPDNPRAIKRGERQVEEYRRELEETEGGSWKGTVETYKSGEKP